MKVLSIVITGYWAISSRWAVPGSSGRNCCTMLEGQLRPVAQAQTRGCATIAGCAAVPGYKRTAHPSKSLSYSITLKPVQRRRLSS